MTGAVFVLLLASIGMLSGFQKYVKQLGAFRDGENHCELPQPSSFHTARSGVLIAPRFHGEPENFAKNGKAFSSVGWLRRSWRVGR